VTVGKGAAGIAAGARESGLDATRVFQAHDRDAALDLLQRRLRDGDVVLVKASRGVELDTVVDALRASLAKPSRRPS
jgi:UDP-N-acetylmuramoyl-tripeptide--D-alanyl-D-alanine ligase